MSSSVKSSDVTIPHRPSLLSALPQDMIALSKSQHANSFCSLYFVTQCSERSCLRHSSLLQWTFPLHARITSALPQVIWPYASQHTQIHFALNYFAVQCSGRSYSRPSTLVDPFLDSASPPTSPLMPSIPLLG